MFTLPAAMRQFHSAQVTPVKTNKKNQTKPARLAKIKSIVLSHRQYFYSRAKQRLIGCLNDHSWRWCNFSIGCTKLIRIESNIPISIMLTEKVLGICYVCCYDRHLFILSILPWTLTSWHKVNYQVTYTTKKMRTTFPKLNFIRFINVHPI